MGNRRGRSYCEKDDFWQDFAASFNQVLQRVEDLETSLALAKIEKKKSQRDQTASENYASSVELHSNSSVAEACPGSVKSTMFGFSAAL